MDTLITIIDKLIWPVTLIVIVMLLRTPLSELIITLKKLKYKDLELEFEKEAKQLLAEAERDLPEIQQIEEETSGDGEVRYSLGHVVPQLQIQDSWNHFEELIYEIAKNNKIDLEERKTFREAVDKLLENKIIDNAAADLFLSLAALRNKAVHSDSESISSEFSTTFLSALKRAFAYLSTS